MKNSQLNIRLKDGNASAYEELFKQTFPRMLSYCRLFIQDRDQSNDLVQECFVNLWEKRQIIDPRQSVESLLFVMLRNRCLNYLRNQKNNLIEKSFNAIEETEIQHLYQLDFTGREERSLEEQLVEAIRESLEELPEKRRLVFIKAKIEGKKNKDIAEELGISVKAVEKHLHQAKEQIRQDVLAKFPMLSILITLILK